MNADDELDDPTPIMCRGCGTRFTFGAGPSARECPICRGGVARPTYWKATRERVMTTDGLETLLDDLMGRLQRDPTSTSRALIAEARELSTVIRAWRESPPGPSERGPTIMSVADWHRRAWDELERARSRG